MTIKDLKENGTLNILGAGGNNFIVADIDDEENDLGYDDYACNTKIDLYEIDHIGVSDEDNSIPTIFVKVPDFAKPGFRDIHDHMEITGNSYTIGNIIHGYIYQMMLVCNNAVFAYCTTYNPVPVIVRIEHRPGTETIYDILIKDERANKLFKIDVGYDMSDAVWSWSPAPDADWCDDRYDLNAAQILHKYCVRERASVLDTPPNDSITPLQYHKGIRLKSSTNILFSGRPLNNLDDDISGWVAVLYKD